LLPAAEEQEDREVLEVRECPEYLEWLEPDRPDEEPSPEVLKVECVIAALTEWKLGPAGQPFPGEQLPLMREQPSLAAAVPQVTGTKPPAWEYALPSANSNSTHRLRKLLKIEGVLACIPYSRTQLYEKIADGTFPRPIHLGGQASFWVEDEVAAWVEARIDAERPMSDPLPSGTVRHGKKKKVA
jgi:prophage regulatory protein